MGLRGRIYDRGGVVGICSRADFAPGGVNGLSLIVRHLFGLPMGAVSLVLNGPVILVTYKLLGRDFCSGP